MRIKKQAMVLSVALSIASLTGSMASCAANQPEPYVAAEEPARFCYQTLGEITCYAAPQPLMGEIVALQPEPAKKTDAGKDSQPDYEPVEAKDMMPPPVTNSGKSNSGTAPISLTPATKPSSVSHGK